MKKNIVKPDRPQLTMWRMRIACWVPKATNAHSVCNLIVTASAATTVARMHLNVTLTLRLPD